jgi:hemolysin III
LKKESFSTREEAAHAISHGAGVLFGVFVLVILTVFSVLSGDGIKVFSSIVYGVSMILLYLSSTLYHGFRKEKIKNLFEIFDHSSIYLLIAGTYTPFLLNVFPSITGWALFFVIWGLALIGVVFKIFFVKRFVLLSTLLYIAMGWFIVFALGTLYHSLSILGFSLLLWGGILYTVGTFFYLYRGFKYHHFVWHLFVLAGSVLHFFTILFDIVLS